MIDRKVDDFHFVTIGTRTKRYLPWYRSSWSMPYRMSRWSHSRTPSILWKASKGRFSPVAADCTSTERIGWTVLFCIRNLHWSLSMSACGREAFPSPNTISDIKDNHALLWNRQTSKFIQRFIRYNVTISAISFHNRMSTGRTLRQRDKRNLNTWQRNEWTPLNFSSLQSIHNTSK